jgi:predicted ATPase
VLWERDGELACLHEALRSCRDGRGATVLVSGEAGLGKTSLLRTFAAEVTDHTTVLAGACDDLHTARSLGPFRDMFEPDDPSADREHYIGRLRAALSRRDRPAVIIVDDAHWADDASLDIIRYLGRRLDSLPGLLQVSYRQTDLTEEHPLHRVLGSLPAASTVRLELRPLTDGTVRRLAEQAGRDPEALTAVVGGNPFFLTEVLAADGTEVPRTVRDAVMARVLALPAPTRRALDALSVLPTGADLALVAALIDGGTALALEDAERAGIVVSSGDQVRYRHELARRAVALESLFDRSSQRLLTDLGVGAGWRCLEVGCGTVDQLAERLIGTGLVGDADIELYRTVSADPATYYAPPLMVSAWGRRP